MSGYEGELRRDADFETLLNQELETVCLPKADPSRDSVEDLIKDIHRVLGGNGGPTRGMIYKVAAANANVKLLKGRLSDVSGRVHKLENDDIDTMARRKLAAMLWENRSAIITTGIVIALIVMNVTQSKSNTQLEQKLTQVIEQHIDNITDVPGLTKVARNASNHSGTTPSK